ncbi:MAG: low affinity iron permease family protein [Armatimonadetes bacterium]|nr:low affinity iron permease family protein [Armatimonadota bacterium]
MIVFLIQNTQNRNMKAVQLKLDELIRAIKGAHTGLVDLEDLSDDELNRLKEYFAKLSGGEAAVEEEIKEERK